MMARRNVLGFLVSCVTTVLCGCGLRGGNTYHFRMTVEVDTPGGIRTGSSVYEVSAASTPKFLPEERARDWSVTGEAVAVDLPGGYTLFALLKTVNPLRDDLALMSMAALDPAFRNDVVESAERIMVGSGIRSPAEVPIADYPLLVTFRNLNDPGTIERVAPARLADHFGPKVSLRGVIVELTNDNVTEGIINRLPWLPDAYTILKGTGFKPDGIPLSNFKGLFSTETPQ